jgi:hypothetical protein
MMTLFREGGFPMWFLLLFSLLALGAAGCFAHRPEPRFLRLTVAMGLATLWTTLTGTCAALAMVGHQAPSYLSRHPELSMTEVLLQGAAESLSACIMGFTVLSLVSLCVAVGFFRLGNAVDR